MAISYPEERVEMPLDLNENLLLPDRYYEGIIESLDFDLRSYPSPTALELKEKIAEHHGLKEEQIVVGNGSDAVLDTICKSFIHSRGTLGYFHPSYEMYSLFASRNERRSVEIPLNSDFTLPSPRDYLKEIDLLMICSPNNPSGLTVEKGKIESILDGDVLTVIDETYAEYTGEDNISLLKKYDNLILVRSFSKAWGLASIRVGYSISSAEKGLELLEDMLPYNVNDLSIQMAEAALERKDIVEKTINKTIEEREYLAMRLEERGFNTLPSDTNFLLCKPPDPIDISKLYHELLERGIRIRTFEEPRLEDHVRITVGDEKINEHLLMALDEIL